MMKATPDYVVRRQLAQMDRTLNEVARHVSSNNRLGHRIMAKLDDLMTAVRDEGSVVDSVVTLIQGLRDQLANAGGDQAKIDEVLAEMDRQKNALAAAVQSNTDQPTPAPAPAPAPDTPPAPQPAPVDPNQPSPNADNPSPGETPNAPAAMRGPQHSSKK